MSGGLKMRVVDIDISSYATGGESITPSEVGLTGIYWVDVMPTENAYTYAWDEANNKLKTFTAPTTETTATTDVGTAVLKVWGY